MCNLLIPACLCKLHFLNNNWSNIQDLNFKDTNKENIFYKKFTTSLQGHSKKAKYKESCAISHAYLDYTTYVSRNAENERWCMETETVVHTFPPPPLISAVEPAGASVLSDFQTVVLCGCEKIKHLCIWLK